MGEAARTFAGLVLYFVAIKDGAEWCGNTNPAPDRTSVTSTEIG